MLVIQIGKTIVYVYLVMTKHDFFLPLKDKHVMECFKCSTPATIGTHTRDKIIQAENNKGAITFSEALSFGLITSPMQQLL